MPGATVVRMAQILRGEVGTREGPRNNEQKYGAWYGFNLVAWCAILLSWASAQAGALYFGKPWRFAATRAAQAHAKKHGRWITTPKVGTIAMKGHTSTTGHVGFVVALLKNGNVVTVEGNTNAQGAREGNGVWVRERRRSDWDGYIVLDETDGSSEPVPGPSVPQEDPGAAQPPGRPSSGVPGFPNNRGVVRRGDRGEDVRRVQQRLRDRGWRIDVDGVFGSGTHSIVMQFQREKRLYVDGQVGPKTWHALWTAPR